MTEVITEQQTEHSLTVEPIKRKPGRPRKNQNSLAESNKTPGRPRNENQDKISVCIYLDRIAHEQGRQIAASKNVSFSILVESLLINHKDSEEKTLSEKILCVLYKDFKAFEKKMLDAIKIDD